MIKKKFNKFVTLTLKTVLAMKKIYVSLLALGFAASVSAQNKQATNNSFNPFNGGIQKVEVADKAFGDTLLWIPLPVYYTTEPTFDIVMEDVDGLTIAPQLTSNGFTATDFGLFFSLNTQDIFPEQGDVDTGFFFAATSWFNPPAQASNWLILGPLTIPAGGANIAWKHRMSDRNYRDGYRVLVNLFGNDDLDFTDPPIFTRADNGGPLSDTNWTDVSATLPWQVSGQSAYIAFHHNANDMFILRLDDIRVTEGNSAASLEDNAQVTLLSVYPNPFRVNTNIAFELKNTSEVMLQMFDLSGKMVMQRNAGIMSNGLNRIEVDGTSLPAGVYYYTLTINGETTSAHKIVKM